MSLSTRNRKVALSRWEKIHQKQRARIIADNFSLALLAGLLAGDGSVQRRRVAKNIRYQLDLYADDEVMVLFYCHALFFCYGLMPTVKYRGKMLVIRLTSKIVTIDLLERFDFGLRSWSVPKLSLLHTKQWLKGFYSAEGYVGKRVIRVQTINHKGMLQVARALRKLQIKNSLYRYTGVTIICILQLESRRRFACEIGFCHASKQAALARQLYKSGIIS